MPLVAGILAPVALVLLLPAAFWGFALIAAEISANSDALFEGDPIPPVVSGAVLLILPAADPVTVTSEWPAIAFLCGGGVSIN